MHPVVVEERPARAQVDEVQGDPWRTVGLEQAQPDDGPAAVLEVSADDKRLFQAGHLDVKIAGPAYPSVRVQGRDDSSLELPDAESGDLRQLGEQPGVVLGAPPGRLDFRLQC